MHLILNHSSWKYLNIYNKHLPQSDHSDLLCDLLVKQEIKIQSCGSNVIVMALSNLNG